MRAVRAAGVARPAGRSKVRAAVDAHLGAGDEGAVVAGEHRHHAGVSVRTSYRYFATKQDAVAPLLAVGAEAWQTAVADSTSADLRRAIDDAIARVLAYETDAERVALECTRGLLRAAATDPALASVWLRVNGESEARLRNVIAGKVGVDADPLAVRLVAAAATAAVRVGLEAWAAVGSAGAGAAAGSAGAGFSDAGGDVGGDAGGDPAVVARRAFEELSRGIRLP